jgi:endonuclease G
MTRRSKSQTKNVILLLTGLIFFICLRVCQPPTLSPDKNYSENRSNLKIEIPAQITGRDEQIISHIGYTVSYNSDWKIPNWVAYELTKEEAEGNISRGRDFTPDPEVSPGMSATKDDYKGSGWDRGHMAPSADMKWSEQAMNESFYFSNICPQNKNLNSGIWGELERRTRDWAKENGYIYVVCGPVVSKKPKTIGDNNVVVPDAFFKALLKNDNGNWSAIAFKFANKKSEHTSLSSYSMSVKDLQTITDIDFFPALPDSIEQNVESQLDFTKWNLNH